MAPELVRETNIHNAGKFLSARRSQKQHEFKAEYYRMKARLAQLESFITKAGLAIPEEFE